MSEVRSLSVVLDPFLSATEEKDLPLLLAILERTAAEQYRAWSEQTPDSVEKAGLRACAATEDEIAEFIETIEPDSERRIADLNARFPTVGAAYAGAFEGLSRTDQLRVQAEGELGGADLLRQFAAATQGAVSARFAALAVSEESNATYLRVLSGQSPG